MRRNTVAVVLGGGRGTRLRPLTEYRSKPAVPLAGKYRLIDIPLSNCINSGVNRIYLLTQFMSVSLHRHIRQTYRFDPFDGGFVEVLAAQQTMEGGTDWYQGTADAVRKHLKYFRDPSIKYVLILSGDQLYRMDYESMLSTHISQNADATIAAMPAHRDSVSQLGVMRVDANARVTKFSEKPDTPDKVDAITMDPSIIDSLGIKSEGRECLASMGIYVFNAELLEELLLGHPEHQDFGREVFPSSIESHKVCVHGFDDYWEDIGTIRAFFDANIALTRPNPPFHLIQEGAPIYSRARFLPPSRCAGSNIKDSIIADGCDIGPGVTIENSVIGLRCQIAEGVTVRNSILMGDDKYFQVSHPGELAPGIGRGSVIVGSIVDKNCRIGQNVVIEPGADYPDTDRSSECLVRDGIPIVLRDAWLPDGWTL